MGEPAATAQLHPRRRSRRTSVVRAPSNGEGDRARVVSSLARRSFAALPPGGARPVTFGQLTLDLCDVLADVIAVRAFDPWRPTKGE